MAEGDSGYDLVPQRHPWQQIGGMTTERQPLTFEACMSDLVAAIGNIKRLPVGLSPEDYKRGQDQAVRLIGAIRDLRYPNGLPAKDHEFEGGIIP